VPGRPASPPIRVAIVAAGTCGMRTCALATVAHRGWRSSKLAARARPGGLHGDRNGLTNWMLGEAGQTFTNLC
jgi:hypothetical protein